jgi:DNA polymerase III subunit gamma/tau
MRHAAQASATLEMIIVRLGYASALPTPAELVRSLSRESSVVSHQQATNGATRSASPTGEATRLSEPRELSRSGEGMVPMASATRADTHPFAPTSTTVMSAGNAATALATKIEPSPLAEAHSFLDVVKLFEERREPMLATHLINDMRLVAFEVGRIEVKPVTHMNADIPARINRRLAEWTGAKWNLIFNTNAEGEPTIREQRLAAAKQARDYAIAHPKVQAVLEVFPDATVVDFLPAK